MKNNTFFVRLFLCAFLMMGLSMFSSSELAAQASSADVETTIVFQKDAAVKHHNVIRHIPIAQDVDDQLAQLKSIYDTPLSTLVFNPTENSYMIHLELRMKPEWTTEDWNSYLNKLNSK